MGYIFLYEDSFLCDIFFQELLSQLEDNIQNVSAKALSSDAICNKNQEKLNELEDNLKNVKTLVLGREKEAKNEEESVSRKPWNTSKVEKKSHDSKEYVEHSVLEWKFAEWRSPELLNREKTPRIANKTENSQKRKINLLTINPHFKCHQKLSNFFYYGN